MAGQFLDGHGLEAPMDDGLLNPVVPGFVKLLVFFCPADRRQTRRSAERERAADVFQRFSSVQYWSVHKQKKSFHPFNTFTPPLQAIQHINQLPEAAIIPAVKAEPDPWQIHVVAICQLLGRRLDEFYFRPNH